MRNHPVQNPLLLLLVAFSLSSAGGFLSTVPSVNAAEPPADQSAAEKSSFSPEDLEFFEKEVRPILVARCYECHQSTLPEPKGGLSLDSRQAILTGGDTGPAAEPGSLEKSLLIDAIRYGDIYQMPPKSRLPAEEVATLEKWVTQGLPWPLESNSAPHREHSKQFDLQARQASHWAWQPVQDVSTPEVKDKDWPSGKIDHFILSKLEANDLAPSGPASKSVLLRRVYFDLIGLPPSVEQVEAFLADESPDALSKVIDQLLASPHFGERWGRHWLDLVRYAESRGHEFDYTIPNVWQYRDYVIRALNADVPYDQFVKEHIAGDLLPEPRLNPEQGFNESILGTGFWFLGEWVHSPVDIRKDETDRHDNMIDVASKTFLALTVSCARCHDHKFDAISQADYYALAGYLQSSHYSLARFETKEHNEQIAKQLAELDAQYAPMLANQLMTAYEPVLSQLDEYLLFASEILQQTATDKASENAAVSELLGTPETQRQELINKVATEHQLQPTVLGNWVEVVEIAEKEPDHPLHAFALGSKAYHDKEDPNSALQETLAGLQKRWSAQQESQGKSLTNSRVVVDYSRINENQFIPSGVAFGSRPVKIGELVLGDSQQHPLQGIARFGAAKRPALWSGLKPAADADKDPGRLSGWVRAGQTLYTPTFALNSGRLHYLVKGKGHIYATVDSHVTNNGPLHGQLVSHFDTKLAGMPQWVSQNLSAYVGHTLHVEFSAEGDQDCSVLMVVEADQTPAAWQPCHESLAQSLTAEIKTPDGLAKSYQQLLQSICAEVQQNELVSQEQTTLSQTAMQRLSGRADLADWLVNQTRLFVDPNSSDLATYKTLGADYRAKRETLTLQIRQESQLAMAMQDGTGQDEMLLIRGNSRTPGDLVPRRFLTALGGESVSAEITGSGRLELAEQMVSPENPFIARVMVNRIWQHLMGRGLVASVDNFGVLGERPSHPELLDYLASDFIKEDWSVKQMIRQIMLSKSYQMESRHTDQADQLDPDNLLWHRANVKRLEGEVLRDALLAVSGHLKAEQFGRSVPIHLTNFLQGRGRPASGPVDGNGRRSIYLSIRRNFLSPMMLAFDMPIPFTTMGKRNVSNVPAQALILMNDPLVVEQSHKWAERIVASKDQTTEQRIQQMYQTAFARLPESQELAAAKDFLEQQAAELNLSPQQAANHPQLWADLGHVLFNAKEFIYLQ